MEIQEIHQILEESPELIYTAECAYAHARAEYQYMDDLKKHILSALKEQQPGSNPERESKAYSSQDYKNYLKGLKQAALECGLKAAELHKNENRFEAARSIKGLIK